MNCRYEIKWSYDLRSYERNFYNCVEKPENFQDFNVVWTRDLATPARRSNQLSHEATDAGSWSFVGSNGPVTADMKSSEAMIFAVMNAIFTLLFSTQL